MTFHCGMPFTVQFGVSAICVAPLRLPALCGASVASVFGTPSHGSGVAKVGEGWDTSRDSGDGFKNRAV